MRLVYLSPVPWASFEQRPHHYVRWFHDRFGERVLWIDPYATRLPRPADLLGRGRGSKAAVSTVSPDWLTVLRPKALPIEPLPGVGALNRVFWGRLLEEVEQFTADAAAMLVVGKPSRLASALLNCDRYAISCYDAMDDFPAFYSGLSKLSMRQREQLVAAVVDHISASSAGLESKFRRCAATVSKVPNGCAAERWQLPDGVGRNAESRPVLGYVGTVGTWFDWPLVARIAQENADMAVRLIGPVHARPAMALPANVELLPACTHADAVAAMRRFTIGLIPFRCNELTAAVDPIKYYEYRALGLPVATTAFGEMAGRRNEPGVYLFDEATSTRPVVELALAHRSEPDAILAFRQRHSWAARFDALHAALLQGRGAVDAVQLST